MRQAQKLVRLLTIASLSVLLSSCSAFGFLFERLPWLTGWQTSKYFDLNDAQEARIEGVAEGAKQWLVTEGFPALITDLELAQQAWHKDPSAARISKLFGVLEFHTDKALGVLAPTVAPAMMSLEESNLTHFAQYMDEKKSDWFESLASEEEKEDRRVERLELWFGDLNDDQVSIVREHVSLIPNELAIRRENTDHWVGSLIYHIQQNDQYAVQLWIASPSVWWTTEYTELRELNRMQITVVLQNLVPTLSPKQQKRASDEVADWVETLEDVVEV